MNWYIGQRIVAVRDLPDGITKKGSIVDINKLRKNSCCGAIAIDIGRVTPRWATDLRCHKCKTITMIDDRIWWFSELNFRPLESWPELSETTYEDIMQEIETKELQEI